MRPYATLAFGHADAFAGAHAQLCADALQHSAEQACAVNAQGSALPMALAAVVVPKLHRAFACIDTLTCRRPCPAPPRGAVPTALPIWRYADYALSQAASLVALALKTGLVVGGVAYHLAAGALVGAIFGIDAARFKLEAHAIRDAMHWDSLPPARNLGAQLSRSAIDYALGVTREDWLADFMQLLPPWASGVREAVTEALVRAPVDWLCVLRVWGDGHERLLQWRQMEVALGHALEHLIAQAAQATPQSAPSPWTQSWQSIDWPHLHAAIGAGDDAQAARLLAQVDLRPLQMWAHAPPALQRIAQALSEGQAPRVQQLLASTPLAGLAPLVTQARLDALKEPLSHLRWEDGVAFCQTLQLADVADYASYKCYTQRGKMVLEYFDEARGAQMAQRNEAVELSGLDGAQRA